MKGKSSLSRAFLIKQPLSVSIQILFLVSSRAFSCVRQPSADVSMLSVLDIFQYITQLHIKTVPRSTLYLFNNRWNRSLLISKILLDILPFVISAC